MVGFGVQFFESLCLDTMKPDGNISTEKRDFRKNGSEVRAAVILEFRPCCFSVHV